MFSLLSFVALCLVGMAALYWYALPLAALKLLENLPEPVEPPVTRFAILLPAHDEAAVIAQTVERLRALRYPADLYHIHIVADHCSDDTATLARQAGASVHERNEGPRSGKGAALSWLLERVLQDESIQAVAVFDADTRVDADFLRIMDAHMRRGVPVVQGEHIICNPRAGWFPSLTWAMFLVDNHYQNRGRVNLGFSAKHMGDSICFRADILRSMGWGEGLTEDYQLRQRLLLRGIRILYDPRARGYGEAAPTWTAAQKQRLRWISGTRRAGRQFAPQLIREGLRRKDRAMLEGGMQAYLPSYSTLALVTLVLLGGQLISYQLWGVPARGLLFAWAGLGTLLFLYPFWGLAARRAPLRAYLVMCSGTVFILWRTWLALRVRIQRRAVSWVRTTHGDSST